MLLKTILLLCVLSYAAGVNYPKSELDCQFNYGFCKWANDGNNWLINWAISSLNVEYSQQQTGICITLPQSSKLIGMANGKSLTSRLWSPVVFTDTKLSCISFVYKMEEVENSKLTLMRREMGDCSKHIGNTKKYAVTCESDEIWSEKFSAKYNGWKTAYIQITARADFKLILEGTIPSGNPNAKICVDNITSSAEACQVVQTEASKGVPSFHSWVEIFGMTFAGALALGLTIPIAVFVVCLFERKRQRGKKSNRIIRHADELDLPEAMTSASCDETNPMPQRYTNSQVGVGHPRLMGRAMSTPVGTNGQGGSYTMGKRNGPQQGLGPRSNSGQMSHTMGRGAMDGGWMMSSQHGDLMENDEYTIDPDYTTHRQMSVPANGYIPVASNINQMDQGVQQAMMYQNRPMPQVSGASNIVMNNNPFGTPVTTGVNASGQDTRSLAGSHANFPTDDNRATPALPFYPPRYEEAMGFNQGQVGIMDEKPPLLPPRIPDGSGSSSGGANTSCSTPLPPAPPPLPLSGHPSAGRFMGGNEI